MIIRNFMNIRFCPIIWIDARGGQAMTTRAAESAGSTARALVSLALPLLIGNIFQQFYNVASTLIVGRYILNPPMF